MLKDETIGFLKKIAPFNLLEDRELEALAEDIALEYYPRGTKILVQDGPPSDTLRIIKKGGVKVYITNSEDKEIVIDYRSEGEHFGMLSVMSGDRSRANILAVEDTICYLVSRQKVMALNQQNPAVNEYFLKSFFINFIDKTHDETRRKYTGLGEGDRLLFTTPVGDIVTKEPITASQDISIQEAARLMARHKISSIILHNESGVPSGIITDRDLREKVVARGRDIQEPSRLIMSAPLIRVDAEEYCFEALLRMMHYKIHHLLVVEGGRFKGIVTNHDFMVLQGTSPTVLIREIEEVQSVEGLAATMPKFHKTVASLLRDGAKAHNVTGLVTELMEKLVQRMADLMEKKLGPSPVPYTLFLYGDGGRRELTLDMRLRIGVIFQDTNNLPLLNSAARYFASFAEGFNTSVAACGCSVTAHQCLSAVYVRTLSDWKELFSRWLLDSQSKGQGEPGGSGGGGLGDFFDMRLLRGDEEAVASLREHLYLLASSNSALLDHMAVEAVGNRPPLGFFKRFVVEKSGEHRNELDIHEKGLNPLVGAVRLLSVEQGIREVSTLRRLHELKARHSFAEAGDVEQALSYLLTLLLHKQLKQSEGGQEPDGFINPETLSTIERRTLKEIFQLTAKLYEILERKYRTEGTA